MAGAVLQPAGAQVRDSTRRDTTRREIPAMSDSVRAQMRTDSIRRDSVIKADTIKAGIAVAELPIVADPTGSLHWTRKDIFATGALTVLELLEHVPGLTGLQSKWIAQPMFAAYMGDLRRLRVYVDGFELEVLDPRNGRVWDLSLIPLFSLDDLLVERTASEVRIHMRTWRVDRTIPFTRTDIYTGDQSTNLYRGLYGRRYRHGEVLQLSAQQFSTTPRRGDESSDQLAFMSRIGMARRRWTADVVINRQSGSRGKALDLLVTDSVPGTDYTRYDAYARFGWQDTARGWWAQGLAGTSTLTYMAPNGSTLPDSLQADTARSRAQYIFTAGYARGPWRASFTQRYRVGIDWRIGTPAVRASWDSKRVTIAAGAEGRAQDSTRRFDVSAVARPMSFLFVGGAVSKERPLLDSTGAPMFVRGEVGIRLRDVWVTGGAMWRDRVELEPPSILLKRTPMIYDSVATGFFATVRGRVWRAIYVDAHALRWNDTTGMYRPQYQVRSEVYLSTALLNKFPTGNFHIRAGFVHEYRSTMFWPDSAGALRVPGYRVISTHLQFKIVSAEVFWTYRNNFGERYAQIPGYRMPRPNNIYGVRWEFWN
jgi:hypothetical protein